MILDLDQDRSLDPARVGFKAAWLARGRRAGLPVLPGFVVEGWLSRALMRIGAAALDERGSGGARLQMGGYPVPFAADLVERGVKLGDSLVARSSTTLDETAGWAGVFTSYVDLTPDDLPKAVTGCWASAFTVAALELQRQASIGAGSLLVSVLVQPALRPVAGGIATVDGESRIVVEGVKGPPAPLLQGWSRGQRATWDGGWDDGPLLESLGTDDLDRIAEVMSEANRLLGATRCEWAIDDGLWILQLGRPTLETEPMSSVIGLSDPRLIAIARLLARAPGALGEELVLPWALGGLPETGSPLEEPPGVLLDEARSLCRELTSGVWGLPANRAMEAATATLASLRGADPATALVSIEALRPPDPGLAGALLRRLDGLRMVVTEQGLAPDPVSAWHLSVADIESSLTGAPRRPKMRVGLGHWEPFLVSVVLGTGTPRTGTPAAPGFGAGLRVEVRGEPERIPPRSVVNAAMPLPHLAPLLWDCSGLVTESGSPAAHLIDSARSLGVPAVCGVTLGRGDDLVALDGSTGTVATLSLEAA